MRSEEVHKALIHGATKFELCQLVIRGVRSSCNLGGDGTPRDRIGVVLHDLAADPAFTLRYQSTFPHVGGLGMSALAVS